MYTQLNKKLSVTLSLVVITLYLAGLPVGVMVLENIRPYNAFNFQWLDLVISNFTLNAPYLKKILTGVGLFFIAKKLRQDQWTALLTGLIFGYWALVLFAVMMFFQNRKAKVNLFNSIKPLLGLLILATIINPLFTPLLEPLLVSNLTVTQYGLITSFNSYLSLVLLGIMLLLNIFFAFQLRNRINELNMSNQKVWIVATLFMGLIPVILFDLLTQVEKEEQLTL